MEQSPYYTIPKIDLTAKSLLMLAQFGFFCIFTLSACIAYEGDHSSDESE